jgi:transaldolase
LELWISGTIDEVKAAVDSGLAAVVATNPTLIARWTRDGRTLEQVVADVCSKVNVPVYVQLHGPDVDSYLFEIEALRRISDQIFPKLVATHDGITAAKRLAKEGLKPLVTAVTTVNQAFLAGAAGAAYVAPYVARIEDAGEDAIGLVKNIHLLYSTHGLDTKIIAASIRTPQQSEAALLAGAHAVVVFYDVFRQMFASKLTQVSIEGFEQDWSRFTFENRADQGQVIA